MGNVGQFYRLSDDGRIEWCFNIETSEPLSSVELSALTWLLMETFEPHKFAAEPFFSGDRVVEVGPRLNFATAWNTNALSILRACGITKVTRIERSRRQHIPEGSNPGEFVRKIHDRMTECQYLHPLESFGTGIKPEAVYRVPVLEQGEAALREISRRLGLGFDDWDIGYYTALVRSIGRNPTNVECFQLAQSNSEHSRHWYFKGRLIIDGKEMPETLMEIVKAPLKRLPPGGSIIAFNDNSSAIYGRLVRTIIPETPGAPSRFHQAELFYHPIFTAETHNFPSGIAPFPGAETGTGGRIRDVQATGKGGLVIAGTAGYCVGNLRIPGYLLPWEDEQFVYPPNMASALEIEIGASNGASDYGNKFGEPLIQGFTRSFGLRLPSGERREWIKPIMFTGGVGQMDARHVEKEKPEPGWLVVMLGGPAYRIGMGGGAASSMIQGENKIELDFNAVQRGDAEMEQKVNRVIRACIEFCMKNPIKVVHDQGAGGQCNVITELVLPSGAKIYIRRKQVGDCTLTVLEIWGGEYQEVNAILIAADSRELFESICEREKVPFCVIGEMTDDGHITVIDEAIDRQKDPEGIDVPVRLELAKILGEMPQKTFSDTRVKPILKPLELPPGLTVSEALDRVLRLVSVGSKRFLTNKVDRSVGGLVARQQCVGPLQLPLSDVAAVSQSHFPDASGKYPGIAIAVGEQPTAGLISPQASARRAVTEMLTNMAWARIDDLSGVRCSGNWMLAAKLPGEGAWLYDAACAVRDIMIENGIAIDGGKDSLSMATKVKQPDDSTELVKSPAQLVVSGYASMPDVTKTITPDIKRANKDCLIHLDLANGRRRLGGSSLAHVYGQIGDECPDVEDAGLIVRAFKAIQELIDQELILSGHDVSDGGLIVTLLEMAFAGNCGININLSGGPDALSGLFAEESGMVIECASDRDTVSRVYSILGRYSLLDHAEMIGEAHGDCWVNINYNGIEVLEAEMEELRAVWEETSHQLERLQCDPKRADAENRNTHTRPGPDYVMGFTPEETPPAIMAAEKKPAVAIIREEGSNSDREMTSAFYTAGFDCYDITMTDLLKGRINLDRFRGAAFVGGFSYADALDSAKGWAGTIRFNAGLKKMFDEFYQRPDTFSLSVCNGCQLAALLGWVPWRGIEDKKQPRFIRNRSKRFESRWSNLAIFDSPAIMLKGMAGSQLGIWTAHGEGRLIVPDKGMKHTILNDHLAPLRYADDYGSATEKYPFNPNGSVAGIAGLCSPDGRHLAMMPHPERTFLKWQWAWLPEELASELKASPWLQLFQNARVWCEENH
jgi:phosphoribosylformylglycinamidine synthase